MKGKFPRLSLENFDKLTSVKISKVNYDWDKAWEYMRQQEYAVTVAEIHSNVMNDVPTRKQVRAWMERQVENGTLAKVMDQSKRVFYMPKSVLEDYHRKKRKDTEQ